MRFKVAVITVLLGILVQPLAVANCQQNYDEAISTIGSMKTKALNNEKMDADTVMGELRPAIEGLSQQGCTAQLLQLMQYIQQEQQSYPAPVNFNMPVVPKKSLLE